VHSLYGSETRGLEDESVESKHVALISHYVFNITTVVFDGPSPPFVLKLSIPRILYDIRHLMCDVSDRVRLADTHGVRSVGLTLETNV